jgi:hypothetical protein
MKIVDFQIRFVLECPVYDGAGKVWRVLNLNTGTVYSNAYETVHAARKSIAVGEVRGGLTVKAVDLPYLCSLVEQDN